MRKYLFVVALFSLASPAFATTRYIAQTAGTFTGGSACNGQTAITPTTWKATAESAGDISYICGTISGTTNFQPIVFGWSGSSGNPITLIFDTGASIQASYCSATGCINVNGHNYITINGGTNGFVESTLNG